jgi:Mn2+/Fe2+ NRAMP family transporter
MQLVRLALEIGLVKSCCADTLAGRSVQAAQVYLARSITSFPNTSRALYIRHVLLGAVPTPHWLLIYILSTSLPPSCEKKKYSIY